MIGKALGSLLLVVPALALGCDVETSLGNSCPGGNCPEHAGCEHAEQQYPDGCSKDTRTCHRAEVPPDGVACDECSSTLERLNIGAPIAPCACTYCAVQLRACFESADYEPAGDPDRDANCRKIVECGWANECSGSDCYCGTGVDRDTCLREANEGRARGPCAALIDALIKCDNPDTPQGTCIFANQQTGGSVLQRATDVALCATGDPLLPSHTLEPMCLEYYRRDAGP